MDDFFVNENVNQIEKTVEENVSMPIGLLKVQFSSNGKMGNPKELHFRDYNYDDALKLGMSSDENILQNIIHTLNECVYEKFDCSNLHEKDIEEILLNMFFNYWGKSLEKSYELDDSEIEYYRENKPELYQAYLEGKNSLYVELFLNDLSTTIISDKFSEPIIINDTKSNKVYKFILPRIKHLLVAKEYIDKKYFKQEQHFTKIERDINYNSEINSKGLSTKTRDIDGEELLKYREYLQSKANDFLKVRQAFLIKGINDEACTTLEDCLRLYPKIGLTIWKVYNKVLKDNNFGVKEDIEVTSPVTGKRVIRTFPFQFMDFLPTNELQYGDGYTVSFGD